MTRQEAIEMLNNVREYTNDEAIDMAIEALTNVQNMHKGKWIKSRCLTLNLINMSR